MNAIKNFFERIVKAILGLKDPARQFFDLCFNWIPWAFPFIEVVATLTPTKADDAALVWIKATFPGFFRTDLTVDERKLYMLAVASEMLRQRAPGMTVTVARVCVQVAYALGKVGAWLELRK